MKRNSNAKVSSRKRVKLLRPLPFSKWPEALQTEMIAFLEKSECRRLLYSVPCLRQSLFLFGVEPGFGKLTYYGDRIFEVKPSGKAEVIQGPKTLIRTIKQYPLCFKIKPSRSNWADQYTYLLTDNFQVKWFAEKQWHKYLNFLNTYEGVIEFKHDGFLTANGRLRFWQTPFFSFDYMDELSSWLEGKFVCDFHVNEYQCLHVMTKEESDFNYTALHADYCLEDNGWKEYLKAVEISASEFHK